MKKIASLKAQAANLQFALAQRGNKPINGEALELIAQQYGYDNWNTLHAVASRKAPPPGVPTLADLDNVPCFVHIEVGGHSTSYVIDHYDDVPLFEHGHSAEALRKYVLANPARYPDGLASNAIVAEGPEGDRKVFTFEQVLGLSYRRLGNRDYWQTADAEMYLCFDMPLRNPTVQGEELQVPDSVKSAKGCRLIALRSHDGAHYDHHVIVPRHLDAEAIGRKISQEITRLKERDRANEDVEGYVEYTDQDIRAFVNQQGCTWADKSYVEIGQTFD